MHYIEETNNRLTNDYRNDKINPNSKIGGDRLDLYKKLEYKSDFESFVNISSNIFKVISSNGEKFSSPRHIALAYAYNYFITWLYRYCKHELIEMNCNTTITETVKVALGMSKNYKCIDYIIKKDGVTDEIGLTRTISISETPSTWNLCEEYLQFISREEYYKSMLDFKLEEKIKNKKSKEPLLATRDRAIDSETYGGTFNDKRMSFIVDFNIFIYCMEQKDVGIYGFYIYSFLKMQSYKYGGKFTLSRKYISEKTGLNELAIKRTLSDLRQHNMITVEFGKNIGDGAKTNEYVVIDDFSLFTS